MGHTGEEFAFRHAGAFCQLQSLLRGFLFPGQETVLLPDDHGIQKRYPKNTYRSEQYNRHGNPCHAAAQFPYPLIQLTIRHTHADVPVIDGQRYIIKIFMDTLQRKCSDACSALSHIVPQHRRSISFIKFRLFLQVIEQVPAHCTIIPVMSDDIIPVCVNNVPISVGAFSVKRQPFPQIRRSHSHHCRNQTVLTKHDRRNFRGQQNHRISSEHTVYLKIFILSFKQRLCAFYTSICRKMPFRRIIIPIILQKSYKGISVLHSPVPDKSLKHFHAFQIRLRYVRRNAADPDKLAVHCSIKMSRHLICHLRQINVADIQNRSPCFLSVRPYHPDQKRKNEQSQHCRRCHHTGLLFIRK